MTALTDTLNACVDAVLTPGAAGAVFDDGDRCVTACVGALAPDQSAKGTFKVTEDTVYDLASLTKLLCTTTLIADAVDDDVIALDEQPFPQWPGVTTAHLLWHHSGLPAHRPLFEALHTKALSKFMASSDGKTLITEAALDTPLEASPGTRTVYSDIGFIALGHLVEVRRRQSLDTLLHAQRSPLRFVRIYDEGFHSAAPQVAPTEHCPWRRRCVHGQVHDDNAFAMGGVAGHAGLFGSLNDVVSVGRALLRACLSDTTLRRFALARTTLSPPRALGFDLATRGGSTGDVLSDDTVGHLGFTGTSLWLDLSARRGYVLLSNTVHYGRANTLERNRALRIAFHRAAVDVSL